MTTALNVGPDQAYTTATAAEASLSGVLADDYEIVIWTNNQKTYRESVTFSGYTPSATFTVTLKGKDGHQPPTFKAASSTRNFTLSAQYTRIERVSLHVNNQNAITFSAANCWAKQVVVENDWNTNSFIISAANTLLENCSVNGVGSQQFGGGCQMNQTAVNYTVRNCNFKYQETVANRPVIWVDGSGGGTAVGTFVNNDVAAYVNSTTGDLVEFSTGVPAGTTWNYNVYSFSDTTVGRMFKVGSTYYSNIAAFNTATTLDANSVLGTHFKPSLSDPLAVNNLGTGSAATEDIFGNARAGTMDVGALYHADADTTAPAFSGGVSGLAVSDLETNGDFTVSCNAATDAGSGLRGYIYYIKAGNNSPFAAPDYTIELTTNATFRLRHNSATLNQEISVGVRAIDNDGNATSNTDYLTVTPTSGGSLAVGAMRIRATSVTGRMIAEV